MRTFFLLFVLTLAMLAQDTKYRPEGEQIPGPDKPADFKEWLADIRQWRAEFLTRIGYDGSEYGRADLKWTQRNFIQPQVMVEDRYLFDPVANRYTVDRYLDDLDRRYGGIDSVLLWPVYPNIGIDNRNQWDLLRDMPGGIAGLRGMIADFHKRGVKVFFPTMAWDNGTRDPGMPYWDATIQLMKEIGADGVNGDTYRGLPRAFRIASEKAGHPVALEPETALMSEEMIAWNNQSWGYWQYPFVPRISKYKWIEPRHMINVCNRWARNKTDDLQAAFFNGVGYESWENIWGIWNGITPRDGEAIRRIAKIERAFPDLLVSKDWEPHTPATVQYGAFVSKWPAQGRTLWTIVNRNEYALTGQQLRVPHEQGTRYFDVWHGVELKPELSAGNAILSFQMEPFGYGAVLAANGNLSGDENRLLSEMRTLAARPLSSFSNEWKPLAQQLVPMAASSKADSTPAGMVKIPAADYDFVVSGVMIEGANQAGTGVQYPWEPGPRRHHRHHMRIESFFIDRYPVTNAEFKKFLEVTGYKPQDPHNFLRHWVNGTYPSGAANQPVVWVSLEDARAYAKWAGKRLPHEWEWQYAAQGTDGRAYPWGNEWDPKAVPEPDQGRDMRLPDAVDAHPTGASPFGVTDMTGNVWQWTDEYVDEHTRSGILRGGSFYQPQGSHWYFPQAYRLDQHGKYLLMAPSKDRSGAVGFRCVKNAS